MKKYAIAALLIAGLATPALAAQFYVAQSTSNHKCSIVSQKPDGKSLNLVGTDGYKTRAAAEAAMKSLSECRA
jgi:opacity protein-like surface antigen